MKSEINTSMESLGVGMTNFDHSIAPGLADSLRDRAGEVFSEYTGWNFYAMVWFSNDLFRAEVWRYGSPREVITGSTLEEIMDSVSSEYGWE
jgi:hypothetical protein